MCVHVCVCLCVLPCAPKAFLQNVPNWDWSRGDAVICLAELKLGFMSQSCLVPGLSTLLTNLFTMQSEIEQDGDTWQNLYREGLYNEIYTEHLSPSFIGMSFAQASKLCFLKLRLLLIGIEYQSGDQDFNVLVNPPSHIKIKLWTLGFLIASNASDARRASMYCSVCHRDIKDLPRMRPCRCTEQKDVSSHTSTMSLGFRRPSLGVLPFSPEGETLRERECVWEQQQQQEEQQEEVGLDSTGLFHWCPPVPLKDISLTRQSASTLALQDHVVVCVFGDGGSSLLGLGDFMMPLRASSLTAPELRTVVFLGDPHYFSREWPNIQYFPNIYFLPGSPLCGADLRALRVERCAMVVVLSSLSSSSDIEPSMQDKETIHFCVNLYHIRFSPEPGPRSTLSHTQSHGLGLELGHNHGPSHDTLDFSHIPMIPEKAEVTPAHSAGTAVPLLVELVNSSNVCFVNEADSQEDFSSLTLTQAFSVGSVFSVDLLDSLMAAVSRPNGTQRPSTKLHPTNLYISNLPVSIDEQELEGLLRPFGQVISTRVLRDYSGASRGVGFARMESKEMCKSVIAHFNGKFIKTAPGTTAPSEPLLCKFADGQRKRHSHSPYIPSGRTWPREGELRLGGMTLTYDPTSAAMQNGYYASPYTLTANRMMAQQAMSPYMSPVTSYQVQNPSWMAHQPYIMQHPQAVMSPSVDHSMTMQPTAIMTQQMGHLSLGSSGAYISGNAAVQAAYIPQYAHMQQTAENGSQQQVDSSNNSSPYSQQSK